LTPIQAEQSNLEVTRVVYSFPVPSQAEQKLIPEILNTAPKGRHRGCDWAHLVLRDAELDVREDEFIVEVDGLLVVGGSGGELGEDEVELGAVVEDVWVVQLDNFGGLAVAKR